MRGPATNRLHGYEVGWFMLLERMGLASEEDLRAAQARVARAAIDRMRIQRLRRRPGREKRDRRE